MTSTITRDFVVKDGIASFPMKEYPNWYGIEGIGFISHGEWSDPEIEYNGKIVNAIVIEDAMVERYREDTGDDTDNEERFLQYMKDHAEDIYELLDMLDESGCYYGGISFAIPV